MPTPIARPRRALDDESPPKLECPHCQELNSFVVDSRGGQLLRRVLERLGLKRFPHRTGIRRRRQCQHCNRRFTTVEIVLPTARSTRH